MTTRQTPSPRGVAGPLAMAALALLGPLGFTASAAEFVKDPNVPVASDRVVNLKDVPHLLRNPTFVTFRVDNVPVREVLRTISLKGGVNMVLDDSIKPDSRITMDVRAAPLDEVFNLVLRLKDLQARRFGTSLYIGTEEAFRTSHIDTMVAGTFRLNYTTPTEASDALKNVLPKEAKVIGDGRTNSLIVVGTQEDVDNARQTIRALDIELAQVVIEVKLVEVSLSQAKRLGVELGLGGGKYGLAWNVEDPTITSNGAPTGGQPSSGSGGSTVTFSSLGNITANLNARLNSLVQKGEARVLAQPRVATQDSKQATIKIVNKIPIIQVNFSGGQGTALAAENVEFRDIGETLTITPRIDRRGYVTMILNPVISVRGKDVIVNRNPVPEINERSVNTTMRVKDGESVVIGGLIRRNTSDTTAKVPLLGDLPLVGFLFRTNTSDIQENEVIIIVTPHIAEERQS